MHDSSFVGRRPLDVEMISDGIDGTRLCILVGIKSLQHVLLVAAQLSHAGWNHAMYSTACRYRSFRMSMSASPEMI